MIDAELEQSQKRIGINSRIIYKRKNNFRNRGYLDEQINKTKGKQKQSRN